MPDISHFQRWSIYWYQELYARYLPLPALIYILVSGALCQISPTSSVDLYIGIRIFVPDISHFQRWSIYWYQDICARYLPFQRWSIYWYQDLCARYLPLPALVYILVSGSLARYLSLPALVYILVSGSLCQISPTSRVGLYISIRIFVPDISHFQRWSI